MVLIGNKNGFFINFISNYFDLITAIFYNYFSLKIKLLLIYFPFTLQIVN